MESQDFLTCNPNHPLPPERNEDSIDMTFLESEDWTARAPYQKSDDDDNLFLDWSSAMEYDLESWGKHVNRSLSHLSERLKDFSSLAETSFEASIEPHVSHRPRWNYLDFPTIVKFISAIPVELRSLTQDLKGMEFPTLWSNSNQNHLCAMLAPRLSNSENVRLRLRHMCPVILGMKRDGNEPAESGYVPVVDDTLFPIKSKVWSLIIKLSLPWSPRLYTRGDNVYSYRDAGTGLTSPCPEFDRGQRQYRTPLRSCMNQAGLFYAVASPNLEECKICFQRERPGMVSERGG